MGTGISPQALADLDDEMLATVVEAYNSSRWDNTAELLATLIEVVDQGNRWFYQAHIREGGEVPDPVQVVRPGPQGEDDEPRPATAAEMREFFGGAVTYVPDGG